MNSTCSLFIREIHLESSIGFHNHELANKQLVIIDLEIELTNGYLECVKDDDLESSYDYDFAYKMIKSIVESGHFNLLETMGSKITNAVIASDKRIDAVKVMIRKPDAYKNGFSECRIQLRRSN